MATGCNYYAQIYDVATGNKICCLSDESIPKSSGDLYIRTVCFSPNGKFLATGAEDRIIRIWDVNTKTIKLALKGHEQDIYSLDWSKDGKILVSGSGDKKVKVWDVIAGECLKTLSNEADERTVGKDASVTSVAISPLNPRCIVTVSTFYI
jgi:glucose repression regulatory protein TUP1